MRLGLLLGLLRLLRLHHCRHRGKLLPKQLVVLPLLGSALPNFLVQGGFQVQHFLGRFLLRFSGGC